MRKILFTLFLFSVFCQFPAWAGAEGYVPPSNTELQLAGKTIVLSSLNKMQYSFLITGCLDTRHARSRPGDFLLIFFAPGAKYFMEDEKELARAEYLVYDAKQKIWYMRFRPSINEKIKEERVLVKAINP